MSSRSARTVFSEPPRVRFATLLVAGLVFAGPLGCTSSGAVGDDAAVEEIHRVTSVWEAALVAGDPAGAVSMVFTADALRMPSDEPAVRGRPAITEALAGSVALLEARFDLEDVEVAGRLAYAAGTYHVRAPGGEALSGKFLEVWKNTSDGWRIHRVMWD